MPTAKTSGNNRKRIEALRKLVDLIRASSSGMSVRKLVDLMGVSESTVKAYLWAMLDGELLSRTVCKLDASHPFSVYTVIAPQSQIDAFMEKQKFTPAMSRPPRPKAPPRTLEERLAKHPNRHVHIALDDEPVKVRVQHQRIPAPDPLLAAFFGRQVGA